MAEANEIFDYLYMTRSERSVMKLWEEMNRRIDEVCRFPGIFVRSERIEGAREIHLDKYIILYKLEDDEVVLVTMVHGMRDWTGLGD